MAMSSAAARFLAGTRLPGMTAGGDIFDAAWAGRGDL
jgi:hypothetical protein